MKTTATEIKTILTPKQEKLDLNDNGKIDSEDLKGIRSGETKVVEKSSVRVILARLASDNPA